MTDELTEDERRLARVWKAVAVRGLRDDFGKEQG